jgi:hypothetical protein
MRRYAQHYPFSAHDSPKTGDQLMPCLQIYFDWVQANIERLSEARTMIPVTIFDNTKVSRPDKVVSGQTSVSKLLHTDSLG